MLNKNNFIRWQSPVSSDLELVGAFSEAWTDAPFTYYSDIEIKPKFNVSDSLYDYLSYDDTGRSSSVNEYIGFIYKSSAAMLFKIHTSVSSSSQNDLRIVGIDKNTGVATLFYQFYNNTSLTTDTIVNLSVDTSRYDVVMVGLYNQIGVFSPAIGTVYISRSDTLLDSLYFPKLIKEEEVSIYINFDNPITDTFGNMAVGLAQDNELEYYDIATLEQTVKPDGTYRINFKFDVPVLKRGCYQFVIYDEANYDDWLYVSTKVEYAPAQTKYIRQVRFRNYNNDIFGYEFDNADEYYSIGLDLFMGQEQFKEKATTYRLYDGSTKRVRSQVKKIYRCQARGFDEYALKALRTMLLMNLIEISDNEFGGYITVSTEDGFDITPQWSDKDQITTFADFDVIDVDFTQENEC